jgi:hypothetical protein
MRNRAPAPGNKMYLSVKDTDLDDIRGRSIYVRKKRLEESRMQNAALKPQIWKLFSQLHLHVLLYQ